MPIFLHIFKAFELEKIKKIGQAQKFKMVAESKMAAKKVFQISKWQIFFFNFINFLGQKKLNQC
jgi:hypothetical protein